MHIEKFKCSKQAISRLSVRMNINILFAVVLISIVMLSIQIYLEKFTLINFFKIRASSYEKAEDFCDSVKYMRKNKLQTHLNSFYNGSGIYYGQYKGILESGSNKTKSLPEKCFKNIFVFSENLTDNYTQLAEFKQEKIRNFKNESQLHAEFCTGVRCVLRPLKNNVRLWVVPSRKREINETLINDELDYQRKFGLARGDDDLESLAFLKEHLSAHEKGKFKVPNIVHFVWFNCHPFNIAEYLCVLSALRYQKPQYVLVHGNCEPEGEYWTMLKRAAGEKLKFVKKFPPEKVFGWKLEAVEHRSDVARLQILLQVGGIYLDTDTMVLKSLDDFRRNYDITLGKESEISLANGAIVASKDSWFLKRWFQEYQNFRSRMWGLNSVQVPLVLWQYFPGDVHVVEVHMMRPNWSEMMLFHDGVIDWSKHWTVHLSTRYMPEKDKKRTLAQFALLETTYGEVARWVLWGSASKKDIAPWVLHPDFNKI